MKDIIDNIFKERVEKCKSELDEKLKKLSSLSDELEEIEDQIECTSDDIESLNIEMKTYSIGIDGLAKIEGFAKIFALVSRFAGDEHGCENIYGVNVTDNSLQACNRFTYIEYLCEIPEELKRKRIQAYSMKELENQDFYTGKFISAAHFFETDAEPITKKASEWVDIILVKSEPLEKNPKPNHESCCNLGVIFEVDGEKIGVNKIYIVNLFSLIEEDEDVTLYLDKPENMTCHNLIFITSKIKSVICPILIRR